MLRSISALIVYVLLLGAPEMATARPSIWFAPLHPNDRPTGKGTADYFSLFDPTSPWKTVSKEISVFQIYLDLLRRASDDQIKELLAYLKGHSIALAVETPVLADTAWCEPGKRRDRWMVGLLARLKQLGGDLQ